MEISDDASDQRLPVLDTTLVASLVPASRPPAGPVRVFLAPLPIDAVWPALHLTTLDARRSTLDAPPQVCHGYGTVLDCLLRTRKSHLLRTRRRLSPRLMPSVRRLAPSMSSNWQRLAYTAPFLSRHDKLHLRLTRMSPSVACAGA